DVEKAQAEFAAALKIAPGIAEQYKRAANSSFAQGKASSAIPLYDFALLLEPDDLEIHEQLGKALAQTGAFEKAKKQFEFILGEKPGDAGANYNLGLLFVVQFKNESAIAFYRKAIELNTNWPAPLNDLAWILATDPRVEIRNGKEALQLAERACELTHYDEARYLGKLDAALAENGRFDKAMETAEKARTLATMRNEN